jgi:hypothetical protein
MAPRKIRVRRKGTDDIAVISERAFKHFAGYYERLDEPESRQPADKPAEKPQASAPAVAEVKPAPRRPADKDGHK